MVFNFKGPSTERKKIFASYTSEKELITRMYRELKKLNSRKINDLINKWITVTELFQKKSTWLKNTYKNAHHPWS
jgi:hypothetical protein